MQFTKRQKRIATLVGVGHTLIIVALALVIWAPLFEHVSASIRAFCFAIFSWDLLIQVIIVSVSMTALLIKMAFDTVRKFDSWEEDAEGKYWYYVLLVVVISQTFQIVPIFLILRSLYTGQADTNSMAVFARIEIVMLLLILGICMYLLKLKTKSYFGMAEIGVALVSNSALIKSIDLSGFPRIKVTTTEALAIGAFTYLLSKGISNMLEGFEEIREKRKEATAKLATGTPTSSPST
jgi:hypothetical protein